MKRLWRDLAWVVGIFIFLGSILVVWFDSPYKYIGGVLLFVAGVSSLLIGLKSK